MLLDRYLRSLDIGGLRSSTGRGSDVAGSRPREQAPAAETTGTAGRHDAVYMITRPEDPDGGVGLEWRLTFSATTGPSWSMALTARGAGPQAPVRVAEAVAVRVLAEFGIDVQGWEPGDPTPAGPTAAGSSPGYCAVLAPPRRGT